MALATFALRLLLRNAIGFAMLFGAGFLASVASSAFETVLRTALPTKPCMPTITRNALVFAARGLMVSMGVPAILAYLRL